MVGWHHQLCGREFERPPGVGDGQGSLMCCSPRGHKGSDMTERLNSNKYLLVSQSRNVLTSLGWAFSRFLVLLKHTVLWGAALYICHFCINEGISVRYILVHGITEYMHL